MSVFSDLIDLYNQLKNDLLYAGAPVNSIKPEEHSTMNDALRDALTTHASDGALHSGGLPAGSKGSILYNADGANQWGVIAPGTQGQELTINVAALIATPVWTKPKIKLDLFIESGGHCYLFYTTPDDTFRYPSYAIKNVYLRDNISGKKVYLYDTVSKDFVDVATGYLHILMSSFIAAADGDSIWLRSATEIGDADYLLSAFDQGEIFPLDWSIDMVSGQLADLSNQYQLGNKSVENVAVVVNIATIDIFKYDKQTQRYRVGHNANLTIKTIARLNIPDTEGYLIVDNSHATNAITVTFDSSFKAAVFTIEALGTKVFNYCKKLSGDSKLSVYNVYSSTPVAAGNITRNYTTPEVNASILTLDFASKNECFATKSGGGEIVVGEDIAVVYANSANFKNAYAVISVNGATRVITFPSSHKSGDDRWAPDPDFELSLEVGEYELSIANDGTYRRVVCSQKEV